MCIVVWYIVVGQSGVRVCKRIGSAPPDDENPDDDDDDGDDDDDDNDGDDCDYASSAQNQEEQFQ